MADTRDVVHIRDERERSQKIFKWNSQIRFSVTYETGRSRDFML